MKVVQYVRGEIQRQFPDMETELINASDYKVCFTDDSQTTEMEKQFSEKMRRADGVVIVSPEYNHGYPGELKLLLDTAYEEYNRKPLGICGVSSRGIGGARMVEQLRLVAIELQMVPIRNAVYFSNVKSLFNADGSTADSSYGERIKKMMEELLWYAEVLKAARIG